MVGGVAVLVARRRRFGQPLAAAVAVLAEGPLACQDLVERVVERLRRALADLAEVDEGPQRGDAWLRYVRAKFGGYPWRSRRGRPSNPAVLFRHGYHLPRELRGLPRWRGV